MLFSTSQLPAPLQARRHAEGRDIAIIVRHFTVLVPVGVEENDVVDCGHAETSDRCRCRQQ